jgi:hypothetical protein
MSTRRTRDKNAQDAKKRYQRAHSRRLKRGEEDATVQSLRGAAQSLGAIVAARNSRRLPRRPAHLADPHVGRQPQFRLRGSRAAQETRVHRRYGARR